MVIDTKKAFAPNESLRTALDSASDQQRPPPELRTRVMRKHGRRRALGRAMPLLVVFATIASIFVFFSDSRAPEFTKWQARSIALEASWRQTGDPDWLASDARAQVLLYRLRRVDSDLANMHAAADPADPEALTRLWRERTETLSALIDSRRQGGVAIRL